MNRPDQSRDFPEKSSSGTAGQKRYVRLRINDTQTGEDRQTSPAIEVGEQQPVDQTSFAYQLLLLQQRLVAYEQLHLEEIAELRQEIEQLRRTFLQETSPQLRAISPIREKE
ncbi:MAG TPA: hypothetical protein VFQ36_16485 [Ktedonobacteraceae bacterium]|nr:hypothetical protein [Ktedonobacteraceae bacterium]